MVEFEQLLQNNLKDGVNSKEFYNSLIESIPEDYILKKFFEKRAEYLNDCFLMISGNSIEKSDSFYGAVKSITNYSEEEILSLPNKFLSIIHPEDLDNYKSTYLTISKEEEKTEFVHKFKILSKLGKIVYLEEKVKVHKEGERFWYERLLRDITKYAEKEAELIENYQQMKNLNTSKDKFISIISHDLRSPFTSLLGFSEILLNDNDLSDEERKDYLRYIHDSSEQQLQLVNHLLDWSRLRLGKLEIEPSRINVKTAISNSISSQTGFAMRKNVQIEKQIPSDLYFYADEKLIERVLLNLISNAIKFTQSGKKVFIAAKKYDEEQIEIIIKDEGVGIQEENQLKLFKIDEKFSTEGTKGEKGTGLGLKLVKEIVEKHNGKIWFYSQPEVGTEFHFIIPEAKQIYLLVEDEPKTRILYKKYILKEFPDAEIIETENGYEALNVAFKKVPSMIISDHDMPLMNGLQMIEVLRKNNQLNNVPVIIISGNLDFQLQKEYEKHSNVEVFQKPIFSEEFIEILKRYE